MSKKLVSKIDGWEGSVTIADPLLLPHSMGIRKAGREISKLKKDFLLEEILELYLPPVLACIEAWDIKDRTQPTVETYPITGTDENMKNALDFAGWLYKEVMSLYNADEEDDPNT